MKHLLEQKVKNEVETVFFINEIYKRQDELYGQCLEELGIYKKYFPQPQNFPLQAQSVGEYVEAKIEQMHEGTNQPTKRGIYYKIKIVFKRHYYKSLGFPELPEKDLKPEIFWNKYKHIYEKECVLVEDRDCAAEYVFHCLRSTYTDIQWLDYGNSDGEIEFIDKTIEFFSLVLPEKGLYATDCIKLILEKRKSLLIIENLPLLEHIPKLQKLLTEKISGTAENEKQIIIITAKDQRAKKTAPYAVAKNSETTHNHFPVEKEKYNIPRKYLYGIILLLCATTAFFAIVHPRANTDNKTSEISLRYFGDMVQQDEFQEGVLFTWFNKEGKEIHTSNNQYQPDYHIGSVPKTASYLVMSSGSYELYPDTVSVSSLSGDTLRSVIYREIRLDDEVQGEIKSPGAQRWYSIILRQNCYLNIRCVAMEKRISPQIAVFADRLGKKRIIPSKNTSGTAETDEISGELPGGKYYIKVRGFDSGVGLFRFTVNMSALR